MTRICFITFLFFALITIHAQKPAYLIFDSSGKKIAYKEMVKQLDSSDVVLFGEHHNNPISHWLQYEVAEDLNQRKDLILGAEMFEADNQQALTDYIQGTITSKELDSLARLWSNYKTDYAPIVNFAKENELPFIATNIPRRYASLVHKKDLKALDSLTVEEKSWIAPLPIAFDPELPTYKNILEMMGEHGSPKLVKAQAIKDATMAHFILKNYRPDHVFLHLNGAFHSDYYEGILWYLKRNNATLNYKTISTVEQVNVNVLEQEHLGKADFIICVDSNMTKTY